MERKLSYCRICEALCGLVVEVDGDRVQRVSGDPDHPVSRGYVCPKAAAMADVTADPDRLRQPLGRHRPTGELRPVPWEAALDDIAGRLGRIRDEHGPDAIAMYLGNPSAFSLSHMFWAKGFLDAVGSRNFFSAAAQDTFGRSTASWLLYGSPLLFPIPDLPRTSFALLVGANPLVSHGSILSMPRVGDELRGIVERGGDVVVVDPVRTRTARSFEHVAIRPGTDAFLLAGMLRVVFNDDLVDPRAVTEQGAGADQLAAAVDRFDPATVERATRVPSAVVEELAHRFASAPTAAAYGRVGVNRGPTATTTNVLLDALNVVTGNLDRVGGAMFGSGPVDLVDLAAKSGLATFGKVRSRVGEWPEIGGHLPWVLPEEIETPGRGQVRALIVTAGNPVLSAPDGRGLEAGLQQLELLVSLDMYVNETNRHADYVLPAPTFLERADLPLTFLAHMPRPFIQSTDAVVEPPGEVREEWEVFDDLAARMGLGGPFSPRGARVAAGVARRFGKRITPTLLTRLLLRAGRSGWSLARVRRHPHGVVTADGMLPERLRRVVRHDDHRVHLAPDQVLDQLGTITVPDDATLLLIGRRELRGINSWLHNVRGGGEPDLWVHPDDAALAAVEDGARVSIRGPAGTAEVAVKVTTDVVPGSVSYPHGYGHAGSWTTANERGGTNINALLSSDAAVKDPLSGASHLDGVPVALEPAADRRVTAAG